MKPLQTTKQKQPRNGRRDDLYLRNYMRNYMRLKRKRALQLKLSKNDSRRDSSSDEELFEMVTSVEEPPQVFEMVTSVEGPPQVVEADVETVDSDHQESDHHDCASNDDTRDNDLESFKQKTAECFLKHGLTHNAISDILKLIKIGGIYGLPTSAKKLLETPHGNTDVKKPNKTPQPLPTPPLYTSPAHKSKALSEPQTSAQKSLTLSQSIRDNKEYLASIENLLSKIAENIKSNQDEIKAEISGICERLERLDASLKEVRGKGLLKKETIPPKYPLQSAEQLLGLEASLSIREEETVADLTAIGKFSRDDRQGFYLRNFLLELCEPSIWRENVTYQKGKLSKKIEVLRDLPNLNMFVRTTIGGNLLVSDTLLKKYWHTFFKNLHNRESRQKRKENIENCEQEESECVYLPADNESYELCSIPVVLQSIPVLGEKNN